MLSQIHLVIIFFSNCFHLLLVHIYLFFLFAGQLAWIDKLSWENEQIYKNASRTTMWVNNTMEGYYKKGGGLSFYWINVAGQVVSL